MSVIVRPRYKAQDASKITLKTAELIKEDLVKFFDLKKEDLQIKPPNDILLHGKKVCGILTESSSKKDNLEFAVIGVGINLNGDPRPNIAEC